MTKPLVLRLSPGNAFSGSDYIFRVTEGSAGDLVATLREGGFEAEVPIAHSEHRQGTDVLVGLVTAGALTGLASLLATFLMRHDSKSVVLPDGTTVNGYGANDLLKVLEALRPTADGQPPASESE